uniref:peroxidase n=1 Tax=Opuntia streptacantha TaxID=393608 RepID=A0A7C9CV29_OPUST
MHFWALRYIRNFIYSQLFFSSQLIRRMPTFMASLIKSPIPCIILLHLLLSTSYAQAREKLSTCYYSSTCPKALEIVEDGVLEAIKEESRMGASLLRLHFHDCFVNVSGYLYMIS